MTIEFLPPVIQIYIKEGFLNIDSSSEFKKRFADKGLIKDLCSQAEWSRREFPYIDKQENKFHGDFVLAPSVTMSPFSFAGKCSDPVCYDVFIDKFAKTISLYADKVILKDTFTEDFLQLTFSEKTSFPDNFYIHFNNQIRALKKLFPLIEKEIISFANPSRAYCPDCYKKITQTIEKTTNRLSQKAATSFNFRLKKVKGRSILGVESPLYTSNEDHPLAHIYKIDTMQCADQIRRAFEIKSKKKRNRKIFELTQNFHLNQLKQDVYNVMFDLSLSQKTHSIFAAGSRLENLYLSEIDDNCPEISKIDIWEESRTIELPYIKELSIGEVLVLREEAQHSLPAFRQLIGSRLREDRGNSDSVIREIIRELKDQQNEVQTEINSLSLAKEKRYKLGISGLALSFVIYGLYSGQAPVAATSVAALLATLAHLRTGERECDKKISQIQSKPAFILFKAKEILQKRK
jgi:hypothetical protein